MQAPMGMIVSGGLPMVPPDVDIALWTLALGLGGLSAHFCLAQAFRHADATVVAPMDFARLPLIAFVGMLAYGEELDPYVFAGGALIFLGNYLNIRVQAARRPPARSGATASGRH
jgi:drug/metabolite transporter (DMT)-like permease